MRQVIIKVGETVWRDFMAKRWPFPPMKYLPIDPNQIFEAEYRGDGDSPRYRLTASIYGMKGNYGNGVIYADEDQFRDIEND